MLDHMVPKATVVETPPRSARPFRRTGPSTLHERSLQATPLRMPTDRSVLGTREKETETQGSLGVALTGALLVWSRSETSALVGTRIYWYREFGPTHFSKSNLFFSVTMSRKHGGNSFHRNCWSRKRGSWLRYCWELAESLFVLAGLWTHGHWKIFSDWAYRWDSYA